MRIQIEERIRKDGLKNGKHWRTEETLVRAYSKASVGTASLAS